jgi:hypothetical protein
VARVLIDVTALKLSISIILETHATVASGWRNASKKRFAGTMVAGMH